MTIRKFRDLPEALLAKGSLESSGIDCTLADDNMVRTDWFYSNAIGGIKLLVSAEDADSAEQILSQPIPEHFVFPTWECSNNLNVRNAARWTSIIASSNRQHICPWL